MITIAPSILSADFACLGKEMDAIKQAGADMAHIDVMDGVFVKNISIGFPVISSLRKISDMFFDVHIMIVNPDKYVERFADAGADGLTFHYETSPDPLATIRKIRSCGMKPAISIKPQTPAEAIYPFLSELDMVLVMTIEPGFGGQAFMDDQVYKIRKIYDEAHRIGKKDFSIQVDGGISTNTIAIAAAAGCDSFVAGTATFKGDYKQNIATLRSLAQSAYPKEEN